MCNCPGALRSAEAATADLLSRSGPAGHPTAAPLPAREEAGAGDTYAHVKENMFFEA